MPQEVFFTSIQRFLILVENSNVDDAIGRQLMQKLWGKVPEFKMVRRRSEGLQGLRSHQHFMCSKDVTRNWKFNDCRP